jgi:hypothetical protein
MQDVQQVGIEQVLKQQLKSRLELRSLTVGLTGQTPNHQLLRSLLLLIISSEVFFKLRRFYPR